MGLPGPAIQCDRTQGAWGDGVGGPIQRELSPEEPQDQIPWGLGGQARKLGYTEELPGVKGSLKQGNDIKVVVLYKAF